MANDIADIGINVDTSSIVSAKKEMENISKSFNSAAKSAATFMQAYDKAFAQQNKNTNYAKYLADVARANQTIINTNLGVTKSYKSAEDSAKMFVAMLNKQESAQKALNLQVAQQKAETGFALGNQQAAQLESLRIKYNEVYAASKLYEKEIESITLAFQQGAIAESRYTQLLDGLNKEFQQFNSGTAKSTNMFLQHSYQVEASRKGLARYSVAVQQVGYQAGDFLVQIQSGTNAFVAFGQQATQLAGLLFLLDKPWAPMAGLIASIAIPAVTALGSYFSKMKDDVTSSAEAVKNLTAATADLAREKLKVQYGTETQDEAVVRERINQLLTQTLAIQQQIDKAQPVSRQTANQILNIKQQELAAAKKELDAYVAQQKTLEETKKKVSEVKDLVFGLYGELIKVSKANISRVFYDAMGPANRLLTTVSKLYEKALSMANFAQNYAPTGDGGYVDKSKLYANMGGRGVPSTKDNYALPENWKSEYNKAHREKTGGGGMSEDTIENKLKQGYDYLELDKYLIEQENISYSQREDTLKAALDKKLITLEEFQTAEKDLTIKHQAELAQIEQANYLRKLQDTSNLFGSLADIASAGGKKSAKAVATFQAIEGTINAYGAAIKALNTPGISLAGRFAAYASVLAAGLKGVSAIRSAGGVGGSSGGAGSVGTSPASAAASASPTTVMIQGMKPTDIFTGEQLSTLFDSLYKENNNRGMVFMVQR